MQRTIPVLLLACLVVLVAGGPVLAAGADHEDGEGVPDNAIALYDDHLIIFHNGYAKMSPEKRVTHFNKALVRGYNEHFENYDRAVEGNDINLKEIWNGNWEIRFHSESVLEVNERDAESHGYDSREALARYWRGLLINHVLETQPSNSEDVVF